MKRESVLMIVVAVVSLFAGIGLYHFTDTEEKPVAQPMELRAIPLTDLDGQQKRLDDWQEPILVINFWAPWCAPCRREIPALINIQKRYQGKVLIVGLALDSAENVKSFADEFKFNYPSFLAGNNITMYNAAFNNKSGSLPHTAIVNQQRQLAFTHTGEITEPQLAEEIDKLLTAVTPG